MAIYKVLLSWNVKAAAEIEVTADDEQSAGERARELLTSDAKLREDASVAAHENARDWDASFFEPTGVLTVESTELCVCTCSGSESGSEHAPWCALAQGQRLSEPMPVCEGCGKPVPLVNDEMLCSTCAFERS